MKFSYQLKSTTFGGKRYFALDGVHCKDISIIKDISY